METLGADIRERTLFLAAHVVKVRLGSGGGVETRSQKAIAQTQTQSFVFGRPTTEMIAYLQSGGRGCSGDDKQTGRNKERFSAKEIS
jgi:hypothetical protein